MHVRGVGLGGVGSFCCNEIRHTGGLDSDKEYMVSETLHDEEMNMNNSLCTKKLKE